MIKKLFLLLLFLIIATPALAVSWPPEVKPEQGKASGTLTRATCTITYTLTFWNVGETGGGDYGNITFIAETKCTGSTQPDMETFQGIFSGGPNGKATIKEFVFNLVNGTYFVATDARGETHKFPVENPEIFSKYRWSMDESVPVPEIKEGKYEVGTAGAAVFNGFYGQVEVNIPLPDGTYDEGAWNLVKIDMKLLPGTRIRTEEESGLMLAFTDNQTNITVGPETEIILVATDPQNSVIQLLWGNLMVNVKKMMKDGGLEVEMSQAVAGIKGTQFILNDSKTESSVKVIEGTVAFKSKSTGQSVDVSKGESVVATVEGLSEKTTFDPDEEEKQWQELEGNLKKTNTNILANKNIIYLAGGIVIAVAFIAGILILKTRKTKKV